MNLRLLILGFVLVNVKLLSGQNIVVRPYLQNAFPTEMTIMWEADNSGLGEIHYGLTPYNMNLVVKSISASGSGSSRIHTAVLQSLLPSTKHYYKVHMEGGQLSTLYTFVTPTLSSAESSTQIIAISDMQRDGSKPNKFNEIVEQGIIPIIASEIDTSIDALEAVMIPGDLVVTGGTYSQWQNHFFNPSDTLFPYVPLYPVPGNHEYGGNGLPNFQKYFTLPPNGPAGLTDQCWYKDISNVRIIGLNSNSGTTDQNLQLDWLGTLLDSTCDAEHIDFVFAELHHPYKSELWTPGENPFTGKVIDSLEQFSTNCEKASIHFFGHTHAYSRGQSRDHKHLWINVATAGGAIDNWGEFPNADYPEFVKSQDEYGFVLIDVDAGKEPKFTIKRFSRGDQDIIVDNVLRDELTIYKNEWPASVPVAAYPLGDTLSASCLRLKASEFIGLGDSLQGSHWQVAKSGDFVDSLVTSKWHQSENYYFEVNLQANDDLTDTDIEPIPANKTYHWRVRYRNQKLEWSDWSIPDSFHVNSGGDTLSANLVLNIGAENGITSWSGDIESLLNAECGSVNPYEGSYNFAVGGVCVNESAVGFAEQLIDLSAYSTEINADEVAANFGAYMRNFGGPDLPEVYLEFYNGASLLETSDVISNANATWTLKELNVDIPISTTDCKIVLKGTRNAGTDNDSYFDNIHFYVVERVACSSCFGGTETDGDQDGFCSDIDCFDNDPLSYPGAMELCDSKDNNCDSLADVGAVVTWTGNAGTNRWEDAGNWNQLITPLACQKVMIGGSSTVTIDSSLVCKGLEVAVGSSLTISSDAFLYIDSVADNTEASVIIRGSMLIAGRCDVQKSAAAAFEIYGVLVNTNNLNTTEIQDEFINVKVGGRFENMGTTIAR